jgi:hypothetical protein
MAGIANPDLENGAICANFNSEINNVCLNQNTIESKQPKPSKKIWIKKKKMEIESVESLTSTVSAPLVQNVNRGTGAGGAKTNENGKNFEEDTNNQLRLEDFGYTMTIFRNDLKYGYYLSKTFPDKTIIFTMQDGFKAYMKHRYGIKTFRKPDESYIIEYNDGRRLLKILEKKAQNVEGSVDTKLLAALGLKREYEIVLGEQFTVSYGFCLNDYFKKKVCSGEEKYRVLIQILAENNIPVLFGDDADYFHRLDEWVNSSS